jgi:tartrate-resistant acid phosphatase type 5
VQLTLLTPDVVQLTLCDAIGRSHTRQGPQKLTAGSHRLPLAVAGLAPGVYLVQLTTSTGTAVQRLVVE